MDLMDLVYPVRSCWVAAAWPNAGSTAAFAGASETFRMTTFTPGTSIDLGGPTRGQSG